MFPAIFLGSGAPTLPIVDAAARDFLRGLRPRLGRPRAIVVASAHWETGVPPSAAPAGWPPSTTFWASRGRCTNCATSRPVRPTSPSRPASCCARRAWPARSTPGAACTTAPGCPCCNCIPRPTRRSCRSRCSPALGRAATCSSGAYCPPARAGRAGHRLRALHPRPVPLPVRRAGRAGAPGRVRLRGLVQPGHRGALHRRPAELSDTGAARCPSTRQRSICCRSMSP